MSTNTNLGKSSGDLLTAANVNDLLTDDGSGNWGLGTESPLAFIDMKATTDVHLTVDDASGDLVLEAVNDSDAVIDLVVNAATHQFQIGGSGKVYIDSSGNLVVGGASGTNKLDIIGGNIGLDNTYGLLAKDAGGTYRNLIELGSGDDITIGNSSIDDVIVSVGTAGDSFAVKDETGDTDHYGNYMIRNQTIQDIQPFPYIHCDGVNDYGVVTNDDNLDFGTNDFSIVGWFKTDATLTADGCLTSKGSSAARYQVAQDGSDQKLNFLVGNTTDGQIEVKSNNAINDGAWHGFCAKCDRDGNMTLFVDGEPQSDTDSAPANSISNANDVAFGSYYTTAVNFFGGDLGDIIFFNRLLTDTEAKEFSANPHKALDWADEGASNTDVIVNGDFSTDTDWTKQAAWTISGGVASYDGSAIHYIESAAFTTIKKGKRARLTFTISNVVGSANIYMGDQNSDDLFEEYTTYISLANGTYIYEGILSDDTTALRFFGNTSGGSFDLDDVSLVQIGATAVYKAADIIADKDGNAVYTKDSNPAGNHITWTGPVVGNRSDQLIEEKGTFTASLVCGTSGTITLGAGGDSLSYVKRGSLVFISGWLTAGSVSSPVGDLSVEGFPYSSVDLGDYAGRSVGNVIGLSLAAAAANYALGLFMSEGESKAYIRDSLNDTAVVNTDFSAHITAGSELWISLVYRTND